MPRHSIVEIFTVCEWKSSAFLKDCQTDDLSVSALLNVVLENNHDNGKLGIHGVLACVVKFFFF